MNANGSKYAGGSKKNFYPANDVANPL